MQQLLLAGECAGSQLCMSSRRGPPGALLGSTTLPADPCSSPLLATLCVCASCRHRGDWCVY